MTSRAPRPLHLPPRLLAVAALALTAALAGCGDEEGQAGLQTAAKVNKEEITVHQINHVLAQQRALPPAQAASASRRRSSA